MSSRTAVDQFGSSVSSSNKKEFNFTHTDKLYVNRTGDTLIGDLNLDGNKLYLNNDKKQSIYESSDNLVLETDNKLIIKNNRNNTLKFYIDDEKIHCNSKRLVAVSDPVNNNDASTKGYVDSKVTNPGDINLNGSKIFFDTNKTFSIYNSNNMLGLELTGFFVIKGSENNDYILFLDRHQINCYNKQLKEVKDPSDLKDAANKKYVDLILEKAKEYINSKMAPLSNPYAPGAERYFDYVFIKDTYKPTFWISGYYNSGLQIINENEHTRLNEVNELTGSGYVSRGVFSYDSNSKAFRFTPENNFSLISRSNYSTHFTFFVIMSQDNSASGRLFTSSTGNKLFGFWKLRYGSIWIEENIDVNGKGVNDGKRYIFTLRNNNDLKTAFINNEQYHESNAGTNDWGKVVLGAPTSITNEGGKGFIYEAICFNKALSNAQITSIFKKLIKYFPIKNNNNESS